MRLLDRFTRARARRPDPAAVTAAYAAIVGQARAPALYRDFAVPDTPEGRLELLMLHLYLVLRRLRPAANDADAAARQAFAQALFDLMFQDLDQNLREMGVGDNVVGKRVKRLVKGFYGRVALYDTALAADAPPAALAAALAETVYDTAEADDAPPPSAALAAYAHRQRHALERRPAAEIVAGRPTFTAAEPARPEAGAPS